LKMLLFPFSGYFTRPSHLDSRFPPKKLLCVTFRTECSASSLLPPPPPHRCCHPPSLLPPFSGVYFLLFLILPNGSSLPLPLTLVAPLWSLFPSSPQMTDSFPLEYQNLPPPPSLPLFDDLSAFKYGIRSVHQVLVLFGGSIPLGYPQVSCFKMA